MKVKGLILWSAWFSGILGGAIIQKNVIIGTIVLLLSLVLYTKFVLSEVSE